MEIVGHAASYTELSRFDFVTVVNTKCLFPESPMPWFIGFVICWGFLFFFVLDVFHDAQKEIEIGVSGGVYKKEQAE